MEFRDEILIPKERIPVLLSSKKDIEKKGKVKLKISKKDNLVTITSDDALDLMIAKNVIEAVGRGFNPVIAQKLFKEENSYELIRIDAKTKSKLYRIKRLIIGTEGKARRTIEKITGTEISVYGKTVAIIGPSNGVQLARQAIELLIKGRKHGGVYKFIESRRLSGTRKA